MIWSLSSFREFQRCPKKWFYNHKVASRSKKDTFRRVVYLLSELESIDAWRGKIVDYTISECIIPKLKAKQEIDYDAVIEFAKKLARERYEFAKAQRYKEENLKKTEHEYSYAALYEFEYTALDITAKFKQAWEEICIALENLLENQELLKDLREAKYLITQRSLTYSIHDFTVKGVPDLIAFYVSRPPHIVDWKVHYFGTKSYNEQLLIYALALKTCNPHRDFPAELTQYSVHDIKLIEYQLLKNSLRSYYTTDEYVEEVKDYIADGLLQMRMAGCEKEYNKLNIEDFDTTSNPAHCQKCPFKKVCWEA